MLKSRYKLAFKPPTTQEIAVPIVKFLMSSFLIATLSACGGGESSTPDKAVQAAKPAPEDVATTTVEKAPAEEGATSLAASDQGKPDNEAVVAIYNRACISCHLSGAAGAPKTHDVTAWAPRMEKGMDALLASINKGLNSMPPKGMCFDCSDDDYRAVTLFMAKEKPAS